MSSKKSPPITSPRWKRLCRSITKSTIPLLLPEVMPQPVRSKFWPHTPQKVATAPTTNTLFDIKNGASGRRCFIVGTAPSLIHLELAQIQEDFVFLVNSAYRIADQFGKKPEALMFVNQHAYREHIDHIEPNGFDYFFVSSEIKCENKKCAKTQVVFQNWEQPHIYDGFFQIDCAKPLYHAHTVVLSAVQMAVWMGFRNIYIIGVDLDFRGKDPHFYKSSDAEIKRSRETSIKNQKKMLAGFAFAQKFLASNTNVNLYNAGVGGKLDCLPRVDFYSLF